RIDAADEGAVIRRERGRPADVRRGLVVARGDRAPGVLDSGAPRDEGRSDGRAPLRVTAGANRRAGRIPTGFSPELAAGPKIRTVSSRAWGKRPRAPRNRTS